MSRTISVLLVDDHVLVRDGVRAYLETQPDIVIVGEASSGIEAMMLAAERKPDVVLMDLVMPAMDGVEATAQVRKRSPGSQVVVLTSFLDDAYIFPAIKAGACSYILKDASPAEVAAAVRAAAQGATVMHPRVAARIVGQVRDEQPPVNPFTALTEREQGVLRHIAQGHSNAEIAAALVLSEKTVKGHVSNLLNKLHLADRTQAAVLAWREGFVRRTPS